MRKTKFFLILACLLLFVTTLSAQHHQTGKATYYGKRAHGAMTASGVRLHKDSFTCAHRTLPFGTLLKVRDVNTDKEVIVKVTDRGPFVRGRIIDLSYAAAKEIGLIGRGISRVEITQLDSRAIVPYKAADIITVPQLEVADPEGNGYCLLSEWAAKKRQAETKSLLAKEMKRRSIIHKARKDSVPRWKIFDKLCAQGDVEETKSFNYIVK